MTSSMQRLVLLGASLLFVSELAMAQHGYFQGGQQYRHGIGGYQGHRPGFAPPSPPYYGHPGFGSPRPPHYWRNDYGRSWSRGDKVAAGIVVGVAGLMLIQSLTSDRAFLDGRSDANDLRDVYADPTIYRSNQPSQVVYVAPATVIPVVAPVMNRQPISSMQTGSSQFSAPQELPLAATPSRPEVAEVSGYEYEYFNGRQYYRPAR